MKRSWLFWHLYPTVFFAAFAAWTLIAISICSQFKNFYLEKTKADLVVLTDLVRDEVEESVKNLKGSFLQSRIQNVGKRTKVRITVLEGEGRVLVDSDPDAEGEFISVTTALNEKIFFRASAPKAQFENILFKVYSQVLLATFTLLILVWMLGRWIANRMSRSVNLITDQAEKISQGDFSHHTLKPQLSDPLEFQHLVRAINAMSLQVHQKIKIIENEKNEQESLLSSMVEGVLAVDDQERIKYINQAAATLLSVPKSHVEGFTIQETIRIPELQRFVQQSLKSGEATETELDLFLDRERHLKVHVSPLQNSSGKRIGLLLVFSDMTRIKELESHRKEFVANVSHELRTPLTSIQGFVETLLNPAVTDENQRKSFLEIIHKHATRLNAIIEDLLALSQIERGFEKEEIYLEVQLLEPILHSAIEVCQIKAKERQIQVELECDKNLKIEVNSALLEQAVVNLIVNAVKYSDVGKKVLVTGKQSGSDVVIQVKDWGNGIPSEHLPRIFERFYRVDKARSRLLGGTGLGLAIVKHIAIAHRGRVDAQSEMGKGSLFSIIIPLAAPTA